MGLYDWAEAQLLLFEKRHDDGIFREYAVRVDAEFLQAAIDSRE